MLPEKRFRLQRPLSVEIGWPRLGLHHCMPPRDNDQLSRAGEPMSRPAMRIEIRAMEKSAAARTIGDVRLDMY